MAQAIYEFNAYNAANPGGWDTNPANIVDGNNATFGRTNDNGDYVELTGNNYPSDKSGTITKVEVRALWDSNGTGCIPSLIPVFSGIANGDAHPIPTSANEGTPEYSAWFDITNDTNAPSWTWSDIVNLDLDITVARTANRINIYAVEIRVTYDSEPEISLDTADESVINDDTPTLLFTGIDPQGDDIRYNIQIHENNLFESVNDTFYFDGHIAIEDSANKWSNDANAFDGSILTNASKTSDNSNNLVGKGSTAPSSGGVISQVRARIYGQTGGSGGTIKADIYIEGQAEYLGTSGHSSTSAQYDNWEILSVPTGGWTWEKIQKLEAVCGYNNTNTGRIHKVELEVTYASNIDKVSGTDSGFVNQDSGGDTDPFNSGDQIGFTVQGGEELLPGTYYWRVRGIDPSGENVYGEWSEVREFTILLETEVNDERNAKITGQQATFSERSAKIVGQSTDSSERSAKLFGRYQAQWVYSESLATPDSPIDKAILWVDEIKPGDSDITYYLSADGGANWEEVTENVVHEFANQGQDLKWRAYLEPTSDGKQAPSIDKIIISYNISGDIASQRSAKITGKDTADDERDSKITGQAQANSERDSKIIGTLDTESEREAKLIGGINESDERDAKMQGTAQATDERDSKIYGTANISDERSAKIVGQDTDNDERSAKLTGIEGSNDERNAKVTGTEDLTSERNAKVTGQDFAIDERDLKITGQAQDSSDRNSKITGTLTTDSERNAKLTGQDTDNDERGSKITGQAHISSNRSAKIHGTEDLISERNAKITGTADDNDERSAKLTGTLDTDSQRDAKLTGEDYTDSERDSTIIGTLDIVSERQAKITGQAHIQIERNARLIGKDSDFSIRSAKITGTLSTNSERSAKLRGEEAPARTIIVSVRKLNPVVSIRNINPAVSISKVEKTLFIRKLKGILSIRKLAIVVRVTKK